MKNFILLLLVCSSFYCRGQEWEKVDLGLELNQKHFIKIHFINDDKGFMIALDGTILKTTDGGDSWNDVQSGAIHVLYDISFANENVGYVNGLKTEDGGETWVSQEFTKNFRFLNAIDENHVIGNIYTGANHYKESLDGGQTWDSIPIPPVPDMNLYTYNPNGYSVIDDQTGYLSLSKGSIASSDTLRILKTIDGRNSWNYISVPIPNPPPQLGFNGFREIEFPSENIGLLVHTEGIIKMTDGGNTFSEIIPQSRPQYWDPVSIYATSEDHYILVGLKPFISDTSVSMYETMDGGLTWTEAILAPGNEYLNDITCTSNNCFAVGAAVYRKSDLNTTSNQDLNGEEIKIFPNPATNYLQLEMENITVENIEIFGADGKQYNQYSIANNVLDVSQLPTGIFFLTIESQEKVNTYKFVKK